MALRGAEELDVDELATHGIMTSKVSLKMTRLVVSAGGASGGMTSANVAASAASAGGASGGGAHTSCTI